MRIFYASSISPNLYFDSKIWYYNLYLPLIDLEHEVVTFDYDLPKVKKYASETMLSPQKFDFTNKKLILNQSPDFLLGQYKSYMKKD